VAFAAAVLRGEATDWPATWAPEHAEEFLDRARRNGVEALLYDKLRTHPNWSRWPEPVRETLKTNSQLDAAVEMVRKIELERVLGALSGAGLRPLLFKGTPLAYSHYPAPQLRPRVDTDLLLPRPQIDQARDLLRGLGYEQELAIPGDTILSQIILTKIDERGLSHTFDLHWEISNPQAFAEILNYEELMATGMLIPEFGADAIAPNAVHGLLIACIHRAAHHLSSNRLIWIYDMHLLIQRMDESELAEFAATASRKQVAAVSLDAVEASQALFATTFPRAGFEALRTAAAGKDEEPSSSYVAGPRNRFTLLWRDLKSQSTLGAALRSLKQQALPPAPYILRRYDTDRKALLPYLYARRLVGAVPKLFKRFG
jgi:Holliday junction resolvase